MSGLEPDRAPERASQRTRVVPLTGAGVLGGAVVAVVLAALGLVLSRVDLVLLALPLAVSAAWAWASRPPGGTGGPTTGLRVRASPDPEARVVRYGVGVDVDGPPGSAGTDAVHVRVSVLGTTPHDLVVTPAQAADLAGRAPILHSGPQLLLRLQHRLLGQDAAWFTAPARELDVEQVVTPRAVPVASLALPQRLQGLTGNHQSARPGDGGDFRDVHPFAPGDRLRRIDWRATARRARLADELFVRRTSALADATVVLVLDTRDDVGENVEDWTGHTADGQGVTSLDLAREAAASLATAYAASGDRVGVQDLASQARVVQPGGGARHRDRVVRAVTLSRPSGSRFARLRPPVVPPGALVYVFSTFLDDEAPRMATLWRAGGHRVVAVDVLPAPRTGGLQPHERVAFRLVALEREERMSALQASGVELLRWQEAPATVERAVALRTLARAGRGPR
ncbi:DUF58 domain-containing protein [Luteimicrobium sp. DT211]|uniref:DUF58 domain-containing protein n=1 Tax=Luteimicrobium sp. DT211 TaxID=3393412 RepID=UPI003CF9F6C2